MGSQWQRRISNGLAQISRFSLSTRKEILNAKDDREIDWRWPNHRFGGNADTPWEETRTMMTWHGTDAETSWLAKHQTEHGAKFFSCFGNHPAENSEYGVCAESFFRESACHFDKNTEWIGDGTWHFFNPSHSGLIPLEMGRDWNRTGRALSAWIGQPKI